MSEYRKPDRVRFFRRPVLLGDAVATIAKPIAAASDIVLGTNLKDCLGCDQRQALLNQVNINPLAGENSKLKEKVEELEREVQDLKDHERGWDT